MIGLLLCEQFLAELNTPITWAEDLNILPELEPDPVSLPTVTLPSVADLLVDKPFANVTEDIQRKKTQRVPCQPIRKRRRKRKRTHSKREFCTCKRSKCLKLYCICYREGVPCGEKCQCIGCDNIVKREKTNFPETCNCHANGCELGYCVCWKLGRLCTDRCKCSGCKNCK